MSGGMSARERTPAPIGCEQSGFGRKIRIGACEPMMAIDSGIAIAVKVIAEGPSLRNGMMVRRNGGVLDAELRSVSVSPPMHAETRQLSEREHCAAAGMR